MTDLEDFTLDLARWAAAQIAHTPATGIRTKAHAADIVTTLDTSIEQTVRDRIAADLPGHALIGEEFGATGPSDAEYTWLCDPVDGTTNYANGIGWCSFSLCCWDADGPLVGAVADPFRREIGVARRGRGARMIDLDDSFAPRDERPLTVSGATDLAGTVLTTEWAAHLPWPGMLATIAALAQASCTVRVMGSSALSLLQVGAGRAAGAIIGKYSPLDNAASALIGVEAGAIALDSDGSRTQRPAAGGLLLAAPGVADAILQAWQSSL